MTEQAQLEPPFNVHLDSPPVERWVRVQEDPRYFVSNRGRMIGPKGIRKPVLDVRGYETVGTKRDGKQKNLWPHRCVAVAFIPNPDSKPVVNHLNGDRSDNRDENLEWATVSEDKLHRYRILRHGAPCGEDHAYHKLTEEEVRTIRRMYSTGRFTQRELGRMFNIHSVTVSMVTRRKAWKHVV